ncbi:MAG: hypothetical protein CL674_09105 [Bdellovibrionaceae bacterium]|nr:hypothetical protein [Pseudobdellovibrionaceae bacterium]|tara:strand:+ start:57763 stop:58548 length:786 start_codon:yes stop_codon:yes gene_type:complete
MLKSVVFISFYFFAFLAFAASPSEFCKYSLNNLEKHIKWPNGFKKFENWDYENVHVAKFDDPLSAMALGYYSKYRFLQDMGEDIGLYLALDTPGKHIILIDDRESLVTQASVFVHENFHRRFNLLLKSGQIDSTSVLRDKKHKSRYENMNLVIDELGAYHTGFSFVPPKGVTPSLLQSFQHLRGLVVHSNKQIGDVIALFFILEKEQMMELDDIKYHHLLLLARSTRWVEIDRVLRSPAYRKYRKSFYKTLMNLESFDTGG